MIVGFRMTPNTLVEKIIARVVGQPVHGGIVLSDGTVSQSQAPNGIEHVSASVIPDFKDWVLIDVPDALESVMPALMQEEAGCGYDYRAMLFGWWIGWASKNDWYCTEWVSYCVKKGWAANGILSKLPRKDIWYDPPRLYLALTALGYPEVKR